MASTCSSGETSSDQTGDLATLICEGAGVSEEVLKLFAEKGQIDVPDKNGRTPLMLACLKGLEDTVRFLLTSGANPNSKCFKDGNTPMHYACIVDEAKEEDALSGRYYWPSKWMTPKVTIVKLLLDHGALAVQDNLDGWCPPCVASLYMLTDVVDLFLSLDSIPLEVKIKVAEILGVSQATLDERYSFKKAFHSFSRAISLQLDAKDAGLPKPQLETSELAACFSKTFLKECCTQEEIQSIETSKVAMKAHAFLVGERLFPENLKQKYLYPSLASSGSDLMFEDKMFAEGFQLLSYALGLERQGALKPGTVAVHLAAKYTLLSYKNKDPNAHYLQGTNDLLCAYESFLYHAPMDSLSDNISSFMESFGEILFNEAFNWSNIEILKSTLQTIEKLMRIIRGRIQRENPDKYLQMPSVTFKIMGLLWEAYIDRMYRTIPSRSFLRVKYVILRVLFTDNVSYKDRSGCNILHLVTYCASTARDFDYLVDLARAFVRHGCPVDVVNKRGQTARSILEENEKYNQEEDPTFMMLVSPPTTVLRLEELATRAILQHKINYENKLPHSLCEMIEMEMEESELEGGNEGSDEGSGDSERESEELDYEESDSEHECYFSLCSETYTCNILEDEICH